MTDRLIIYPEFDSRIERDYMYSVSVTQGEHTARLPVYNHTEDSRVNRNPIDERRADEYRRFSTFAFCGAGVRVDIRVNRDFQSYSVIPSAKRFRHEFHDGIISVFLDKPDYFAIRLDGKDHTILSVLSDLPESEIPEAGENTYIIDGWHEVDGGLWTVNEPNTTIYIKAGAVLNARVRILADNCRILGRGAIVDPVGDIYRYDASRLDNGVVLVVHGASNTLIDGIHMLDSKAFNIEFVGIWEKKWAVGNRVRNAKILSTQMSSDGITMCYYSKDSYAEHCFVYCADNALVYEEGAHYKDITVGTTCNALFPQTDVVDSSAEDIYVFRADEGIINCEYCGENGITRLENSTVKNLSAVDVTFAPYFLYTEIPTDNPVISKNGGFTVENVWLPPLDKTLTPIFYRNIASGDYEVTLKNVSIGGRLIEAVTEQTVKGEVNTGGHTFRYITDGDFDASLAPNTRAVNYRNGLNVFVGECQIYLRDAAQAEGDDVLLPFDEMCAELRTQGSGEPVLKDGKRYIYASMLAERGFAKAVEVRGSTVKITPVYNGENLILPDSGAVSKYTEHICYASHLLALRCGKAWVYRILNTNMNKMAGIFRLLCEEIKKYGCGTYRLCFEARSDEKGRIRAIIDYSGCEGCEQVYDIGPEFCGCSLDIPIGELQLSQAKLAMIICSAETALKMFDIKNISLVKIN